MIRRISGPTCIYITLVRKIYIDVTCLSGDSSGGSKIAATIAIAQKKEREKDRQRETKGKN